MDLLAALAVALRAFDAQHVELAPLDRRKGAASLQVSAMHDLRKLVAGFFGKPGLVARS